MRRSECLCGFTRCKKYGCLVKQPYHLVEKVCFFKKVLVLYPYKNALWALRPAKPLGVLSRHPCRNPKPLSPVKGCVCLVGSASCRALGHTRPASVPGLSVGLPPLDPVGGYAPATPFLSTIEVYRQSEIRLSCETAVFYKDSYRKISVFLQLS